LRKRLFAALLLLALLLPGCSAMLERSYVTEAPHTEQSAADADVLRAEDYDSLVSALAQLVQSGAERGVIRLYNYTGDVGEDVSNACLSVTQDDPLGAYSVSYISHEWSRIVSYYEVSVHITYRRTVEQVANIVSITGTDGIREELAAALERGDTECVLRVSRFTGSRDDVLALAAEVFSDLYGAPDASAAPVESPAPADNPGAGIPGAPSAEVNLYPDEGEDRIVEFLLTYPEEETASPAVSLNPLPAAASPNP